jgi:dipeptidase E
MRLLLFSNSTNAGEEYLNYTLPYIQNFLNSQERKVLFIPFAGITPGFDNYEKMVAGKLGKIGISIESLHKKKDKSLAIRNAWCIMIGGGNTFCLLKALQDYNLLDIVRERLRKGIPYIGWSAGSNIVCPTIRTTNDMPITEPENFDALQLIPFQINPHYTDFVDKSHAGETREMRIEEFLLINKGVFVAGLREGTLLKINDNSIQLMGERSCRIFKYGEKPREVYAGENLGFLMQ